VVFGEITGLHVDEEAAMRGLTAELIEEVDDAITVTSESDPDAPARLDADPIDCVVSDFTMPECTGLERCTAVRTEHPWLPFVLFTCEPGEDPAEDAIARGAPDHVRKAAGTHHYTVSRTASPSRPPATAPSRSSARRARCGMGGRRWRPRTESPAPEPNRSPISGSNVN
jgi:CheY-like chemotaxis protein